MKSINKIMAGVVGVVCVLLSLSSCNSIPEKATPVADFDINKYMGVWYEIARIDFKHERNLNNVSAQYTLNDKGNVDVVNSGYNYRRQKWEKAEAIAKFRGEKNVGALKVSFFGPFYSGYNVLAVDDDYNYALVAGKNLDYLWILSRTQEIPLDIKSKYLEMASQIGYDTSRLTWVKHDKENPYLKGK